MLTIEEALLACEATMPDSAAQVLAAEFRKQHAALEETLKDLALASAERDIASAEIERLRSILDGAFILDDYQGKNGRRDWARNASTWLHPGEVVAVLDDWRKS